MARTPDGVERNAGASLTAMTFNLASHIAREIMRRLDLAGDELPSSLEAFVERHLGPERQLTLRLA